METMDCRRRSFHLSLDLDLFGPGIGGMGRHRAAHACGEHSLGLQQHQACFCQEWQQRQQKLRERETTGI